MDGLTARILRAYIPLLFAVGIDLMIVDDMLLRRLMVVSSLLLILAFPLIIALSFITVDSFEAPRDAESESLADLTLKVLDRKVVLSTIPQILKGDLACSTQALDISNPLHGLVQELRKQLAVDFLVDDVTESIHHRDTVGSNPGLGINREDVVVIILLYKIGTRHDLSCYVQWERWKFVAGFGIVALSILLLLHVDEGFD